MRCLVLLLALAGLCVADYEVEDNVLVLTSSNFQEVIQSTPHVLVEFYAPWCGHCKALAPEYAKAAGILVEEGSDIKLAKVDATVESELAQEYGVRGYPTIKFFKSGNELEYSGGRTSDDIVAWLKKRTGPPAESLTTVEQAKAFVDKADVVVVGFFSDLESDAAKAYIGAADTQDSLLFGISDMEEVATALEATRDSIVLFKKFDEGRVTYSGEYDIEPIVEFIQAEQLPLVTTFSDETAPKIFGGNFKTHLLAFYSSEASDADTILTELRETATQYKGKILVVHIDTSDSGSSRIMDFFNLEEGNTPTSRLINLEDDMKKYVPEFNDLDSDKLIPWIQDYLDGKLSPHLNSEEIPDDWDAGAVKVVVGKNFESVVMDSSKHVFLEFYAPWCGHCKQLAPVWEQLAEHFADDGDVVIAKMDATKNEVEAVSVQGFPTLKFFQKGTNEMVDYNGGRTLDDLIQFVEAQMEEGGEQEEEEEEEAQEEEVQEEEQVEQDQRDEL